MDRNLTTEPAKEKNANTLIIFSNIKGLNTVFVIADIILDTNEKSILIKTTVFVIADIKTNFRHE
jgi:hypothetical protein